MSSTHRSKVAQLRRLTKRGVLRARDLDAKGIPRAYLARMVATGELERAGRGLYRRPDAEVTELHSVVEVAARVPQATVCLLTALQLHGLTTQAPHAVWIMIDSRARSPLLETPAVEIVRARGAALTYGTETRTLERTRVRVTTPAKTIADCFRYRRHVGLDVALEALRDYLARSRSRTTRIERAARKSGAGYDAPNGDGRGQADSPVYSVDALAEAARADRIYSVMRPYLEALA